MGKNKYNRESLIEASKKCHNSEFDNLSYEKTEYKGYNTKVTLTCHNKDENGVEHGDFDISITHLLGGQGCPKCRYLKSAKGIRRTIEEVITEARKVHGDTYDYSLIKEYKNDRTKYPIICKEHGVFYQTFNNHIKFKQGCPICGNKKCHEARKLTFKEFVDKANLVHGNKYVYYEEDFLNRKPRAKFRMNCPKHGDFYQTLSNHLFGQGCPICNESKLEKELRIFFSKKNENFEQQKKFEWLGKQSLDFYLPQYNIAIECQGKQHFLENCGWSTNGEGFDIIKARDEKKRKLCEENGIKLLYYSNLGIEYPYKVFEDKEKLLEEILKSEDFDISLQKTENI